MCVAFCCSALQCVAVCCSVLLCVAVCCRTYAEDSPTQILLMYHMQHTATHCNYTAPHATHIHLQMSHVQHETLRFLFLTLLQCVAVCCSVLQWVQNLAIHIPYLVAVCCSVLQCVALCCRDLQCVPVSSKV